MRLILALSLVIPLLSGCPSQPNTSIVSACLNKGGSVEYTDVGSKVTYKCNLPNGSFQ